MRTPGIKEQMIEELNDIPEEKLQILLELIKNYKLEHTAAPISGKSLTDYAGSWKEIGTQEYDAFLKDIKSRRRKANRERNV